MFLPAQGIISLKSRASTETVLNAGGVAGCKYDRMLWDMILSMHCHTDVACFCVCVFFFFFFLCVCVC